MNWFCERAWNELPEERKHSINKQNLEHISCWLRERASYLRSNDKTREAEYSDEMANSLMRVYYLYRRCDYEGHTMDENVAIENFELDDEEALFELLLRVQTGEISCRSMAREIVKRANK